MKPGVSNSGNHFTSKAINAFVAEKIVQTHYSLVFLLISSCSPNTMKPCSQTSHIHVFSTSFVAPENFHFSTVLFVLHFPVSFTTPPYFSNREKQCSRTWNIVIVLPNLRPTLNLEDAFWNLELFCLMCQLPWCARSTVTPDRYQTRATQNNSSLLECLVLLHFLDRNYIEKSYSAQLQRRFISDSISISYVWDVFHHPRFSVSVVQWNWVWA